MSALSKELPPPNAAPGRCTVLQARRSISFVMRPFRGSTNLKPLLYNSPPTHPTRKSLRSPASRRLVPNTIATGVTMVNRVSLPPKAASMAGHHLSISSSLAPIMKVLKTCLKWSKSRSSSVQSLSCSIHFRSSLFKLRSTGCSAGLAKDIKSRLPLVLIQILLT